MTNLMHHDKQNAFPRPSAGLGKPSSQQSIHFFDCAQLAPEAWASGGGTTRTIAKRAGDDGGIEWRVSLATLNGPASSRSFRVSIAHCCCSTTAQSICIRRMARGSRAPDSPCSSPAIC
jgi:hypothetical protein